MIDGERWLAGLVALVCVVFLVRLVVGERRRVRLDDWWFRVTNRLARRISFAWTYVTTWKARRQAKQAATEEANALIERARQSRVERRGNVYTPQSFKQRRERGQANSDQRPGNGPH
jgi:ABC-type nickel/cobalt efflux system permease component RcnA